MDKSFKTKANLLKIAVMLFEEHGFNNTTIRMIADEAGIGRGNLTYHFPQKEDISDLLMRVFFMKVKRFTSGSIDYAKQDAYVYFMMLLKTFEYFTDNTDYFKMMTLDSEKSQMIYRQSCVHYYELIKDQLEVNEKTYDSNDLKRSVNFGVLIFDNIIINRIKGENAYEVEAAPTAIRHFMTELNESNKYMNSVIEIANSSFEKIDLEKFHSYIMGYDYEDLLRELHTVENK